MKLTSITATPLSIPFQEVFRHASAERSVTATLWVNAHSAAGVSGYGEGCPRDYVTGESLDSAFAFVAAHEREWVHVIDSLAALQHWIAGHQPDIDRNPAAWSAVELALLDLLGKTQQQPVEALLGLPPLSGDFHYSAVLGDAPVRHFDAQLQRYVQLGFSQFKIKLSGVAARDAEKIAALRNAGIAPQVVRADANNLWSDSGAALRALEALAFEFFALEEPLRAGDYSGMLHIATALDTHIILDESLLRSEQLTHCRSAPERWIANLRISKMGGVLRSLALVQALREHGLRAIVGAHVGETSLLTRAGLTIAQAARDILVAQEGAFGTHLLQRDVVAQPLMFGRGGVMCANAFTTAPGFGLAVTATPG